MDKLFLEKIPGAAIPTDENCQQLFNSFEIGQKFEIVPWKDRKYSNHKAFFKMVNIVVQNNMQWKSAHFLIKLIQIDLGNVDVGVNFKGEVEQFPKSIAFKNMSEIAFKKLFSEFVDYILANLNVLIPGMKESVFQSYVMRILEFG